jgi:hypothetical protein
MRMTSAVEIRAAAPTMGKSSRPRCDNMFAALGGTAKTTSSLPSANNSRVRRSRRLAVIPDREGACRSWEDSGRSSLLQP